MAVSKGLSMESTAVILWKYIKIQWGHGPTVEYLLILKNVGEFSNGSSCQLIITNNFWPRRSHSFFQPLWAFIFTHTYLQSFNTHNIHKTLTLQKADKFQSGVSSMFLSYKNDNYYWYFCNGQKYILSDLYCITHSWGMRARVTPRLFP